MARPKKQVVDYFPHTCVSGKTIFILEQKWGNDGYAFWFKLLERLGTTEGHFLDLKDEPELLYLQSVTRLAPSICDDILTCLSNINAIDKELWQNSRVVWSQNFVDGLADLYSRRKVDTPTRDNASGIKPLEQSSDASDDEKRKIWCRNALNRAVESGKIQKLPCVICKSETDLQGHHYNYDFPLDVIWMCQYHHIMLHNNHLNGINVYHNPAEWDKWINSVNINPYIKVKESKVDKNIVTTAVSPVAPAPKKKRDNKKKPDAEPYWSELVSVYFGFCFEKFNEKPSFTGSDPSEMHRIIECLRKRAIDQGVEWTQEAATLRWRGFLGTAYRDDWLSKNWILSHLSRQKDKIFLNLVSSKNGTYQNTTGTIGQTIEFD